MERTFAVTSRCSDFFFVFRYPTFSAFPAGSKFFDFDEMDADGILANFLSWAGECM
ncbi:MAG: hypothetical protein IJ274_03320 [Lachnospiraceae bacterium]|nr:hypothetical protein [Lachnospiraceae bacterium]